ncbi:MAG: 50S ribosomal protein L4 [candidate division WOR-3 bacterium]
MPVLDVLSATGQASGSIDLPDAIFGLPGNRHLLWETVNYYRDAQRQGTARTKTREEISGGGRKPWRQKHTGRARHGSIRSPIWRHGGTVFGPMPRDYATRIPVNKRRLALAMVLSDHFRRGSLRVVEDLEVPTGKTGELDRVLSRLGVAAHRTMLVVGKSDPMLCRAARNIPNLRLVRVQDLNACELMVHERLLLTRSAVEVLRNASACQGT